MKKSTFAMLLVAAVMAASFAPILQDPVITALAYLLNLLTVWAVVVAVNGTIALLKLLGATLKREQ